MSLRIFRLLIIRISRNLKSFFKMKFKFDGVEEISNKVRIFFKVNLIGRKMLKWDQDHLSPLKVDQPRFDYISLTFHIGHQTKEHKNIRQLRRIRLIQKLAILFRRWYVQRRFRGSDRWEPKPTRISSRLKQNEIIEKQRSYYDAGISAEVITKDIPGLIPRTIYNHY